LCRKRIGERNLARGEKRGGTNPIGTGEGGEDVETDNSEEGKKKRVWFAGTERGEFRARERKNNETKVGGKPNGMEREFSKFRVELKGARMIPGAGRQLISGVRIWKRQCYVGSDVCEARGGETSFCFKGGTTEGHLGGFLEGGAWLRDRA